MLVDSDHKHMNDIFICMGCYYDLFYRLQQIEYKDHRFTDEYLDYLDYMLPKMFECDSSFIAYNPNSEKTEKLMESLYTSHGVNEIDDLNVTVDSLISFDCSRTQLITMAILNRLATRYRNKDIEVLNRLDRDIKLFNSTNLEDAYNWEKAKYLLKPGVETQALYTFLSLIDKDVASSKDKGAIKYMLKAKYDISFVYEKINRTGINLEFDYQQLSMNSSFDEAENMVKNEVGMAIVSNCINKFWQMGRKKSKNDMNRGTYLLYINWLKTGFMLMDSYSIEDTKEGIKDFNVMAKSLNAPISNNVFEDIISAVDEVSGKKKIMQLRYDS